MTVPGLGRIAGPCQDEVVCRVTVEIPEKMLVALDLSLEELGDELKLAAAMKLYELGRLSSGAASELAGIPKPTFLARLGDYGIPAFRMTKEELEQDFENA